MYSYENTLAKTKPAVQLYLHVEDSLSLFDIVRSHKEGLVKQFCEMAGFSAEDFWQKAYFVVACHDIGKATVSFQNYLRTKKQRESHALISSYFVRQACDDVQWFTVSGRSITVEAMVVAAHHSPLRQGLFQKDYAGNLSDPELLHEVVERLAKEVIEPGFRARFLVEKPLHWRYPSNFNEIYEALKRDEAFARILKRGQSHLRILFALFKSILHYCDWYASGQCFDVDYAPSNLRHRVGEHLQRKGVLPGGWWTHQTNAANHEGHGLLQAPTGRGKTEAALLWADRNAQGRKILYLLPTMTTTNRMRKRLQETLQTEVGIVHGTSDYLLAKEQDFESRWDFRRSLFAKAFITPCTVATVDQFLFPMFNWGRWELRLANAANSAIIFDEIHCYQPYTVALIVRSVEFFHELGAKLLFVSATFPQVLRDILKEHLPIQEIPRDESLDDLCLVEIDLSTTEKELAESVSGIVGDYRRGKRVLVVCNTVANSKDIFQCLEDIPLQDRMLLHSQFILKHRHAKEDVLEDLPRRGFVAVTTQVVEVSLDIDFDVLYTEFCPLDALIQRLGRVNRKGRQEKAPVYLHHPSGNWRYVYDPQIVEESTKAIYQYAPFIAQSQFRQMVDEIYEASGYMDKFNQELDTVRDRVARVQDNCSQVYTLSSEDKDMQKLTTRRFDYLTVDAIPATFKDEVIKLENKIERVGYSVRVPLFKNHRYLEFRDDGMVFVHVKDYNEITGVEFHTEDDIESRVT